MEETDGDEMRKTLIVGAALAAIAAGAAYLYFGRGPDPSAYRTGKVERGDIVDAITATGNIAAVTTVSVGSQISGTINEILVDFNSRVRKGQVIARIDPRLIEASVLQNEGNVENARAAIEKAKISVTDTGRTYRRNQELLRDGFVSQSDVDSALTGYEQAQAQLKSAEAGLKQALGSLKVAQTNLENATIRSPVDGIVISRSVDVGQTVAASFQTPTLFSIAQDLTKMQIDTNVDESDIGRAAPGQHAAFTVDAWPDREFRGKVSQVRNAPMKTENVVTYNVVVLVDNHELLLKPGMTANVTLLVKEYKDILKIPNAALRYRPSAERVKGASIAEPGKGKPSGGQRVFRLGEDGRPRRVPVRTGVSNGAFTELVEGDLKEGDVLVLHETPKGSARPSSGGIGPPGGFR